jgi:hypothetical protein
MANERAKSNKKIIEMQSKLEDKVQEYELKLKNNNNN